MTLRRGPANSYVRTHEHIPPRPTTWMRTCGRCSAKISHGKRHPIYSYVCREKCK